MTNVKALIMSLVKGNNKISIADGNFLIMVYFLIAGHPCTIDIPVEVNIVVQTKMKLSTTLDTITVFSQSFIVRMGGVELYFDTLDKARQSIGKIEEVVAGSYFGG